MDRPPKPRTHGPTCGFERRWGRGPCGNPAGLGTEHLGYGHCRFHMGNAPNHVKQAQALMTEAAAREFGLPIETTADEALLGALYHANGRVVFYRARVAELTPEQMVQGVQRITRTRRLGDEGAQVIEDTTVALTTKNIWVTLLQEAETHQLKVAATVAQLNIEDRRVKLAEEQGAMFYEALVLSMQNTGLSPEQQTAMLQALPAAVQVVTGEVVEELWPVR